MRLTRLGVILITVFALQDVTGSPVGLRPEGHARLAPTVCRGQAQQQDAAYAEKIKAYTTDERFLWDLVDHLLTSESVRTGRVVSL